MPYPQHHPLVSAAPLSQSCPRSLPGPKRTAPGDGRALLTAFRNKLASFELAGKKLAEPRCAELEIGSQSLFFFVGNCHCSFAKGTIFQSWYTQKQVRKKKKKNMKFKKKKSRNFLRSTEEKRRPALGDSSSPTCADPPKHKKRGSNTSFRCPSPASPNQKALPGALLTSLRPSPPTATTPGVQGASPRSLRASKKHPAPERAGLGRLRVGPSSPGHVNVI